MKNKTLWILGGIIVLIILVSILGGSNNGKNSVAILDSVRREGILSNVVQDNIADVNQAVINISNDTGFSTDDVAKAIGTATHELGNFPVGKALTSDGAKVARAKNLNLVDFVNQLIPMFDEWQFKTESEAKDVVTNLLGASVQGKVSLFDLISTLKNTGWAIKDKTTITEAAAAIEALSNQNGMNSKSAIDLFTKVTKAIGDSTDKNNWVFGNMKKVFDEKSLTGAIEQAEGCINGSVAKSICQGQDNEVVGFEKITIKDLISIDSNSDNITKHSFVEYQGVVTKKEIYHYKTLTGEAKNFYLIKIENNNYIALATLDPEKDPGLLKYYSDTNIGNKVIVRGINSTLGDCNTANDQTVKGICTEFKINTVVPLTMLMLPEPALGNKKPIEIIN